MSFEESLRLSIALGLTIFLVLLRFDSERIMRSDYFRYRYPWLGPVSYYGLVIAFAVGIVLILPFTRPLARRLLTRLVSRRLLAGSARGRPGGRPGDPPGDRPGDRQSPGDGSGSGPVVRGEVVDE